MNRTFLRKVALCCGLLISLPFVVFGQVHEGEHHSDLTVADTVSFLSFNDFHGAFVKDRNVPGAAELVQAVLEEKAKNKILLLFLWGITSVEVISLESLVESHCRRCLKRWMSKCRQ